MKKLFAFLVPVLLLIPVVAWAHFGMLIPSVPTVMETKDSSITLEAKFWHPFENSGMDLVKPKNFEVIVGGEATDLLSSLKEVKQDGKTTWSVSYKVARPGLYKFVMEPQPYWEPQEDKFIIHYTKVYVDAFGDDEGWNEPIEGLKTEIIPLIKPGALYAGNTFVGKLLLDGHSVASGEVEVEWYPGPGQNGQAPYDSMVTQVVLTDAAGIFVFTPPAAGWWGFAGLNDADYKLPLDGKDRDVELGAVFWVYFHEFKPSKATAAK
jgi:cobalt/nickel transport protein